MKRFHLSGSADYTWLVQVDAETEEEAREKADQMVKDGQATDERFSFVHIDSCDEEKGVFDTEKQ